MPMFTYIKNGILLKVRVSYSQIFMIHELKKHKQYNIKVMLCNGSYLGNSSKGPEDWHQSGVGLMVALAGCVEEHCYART